MRLRLGWWRVRNLQHADDEETTPGAVRETVARLRRRAETLSESQIRFAIALDIHIQAGLHRAAGYAKINDFLRSEFARMSVKTLQGYLESGRYMRTHKIAPEEAIGRGFERIFLEARAYAGMHRMPDPVRELRDLTAAELRRIANWRPTRSDHPNGTADQATKSQFVGKVITEFGYTTRSFRIATTGHQAAVYTPSGKGRLIIRVMPTEQGG